MAQHQDDIKKQQLLQIITDYEQGKQSILDDFQKKSTQIKRKGAKAIEQAQRDEEESNFAV